MTRPVESIYNRGGRRQWAFIKVDDCLGRRGAQGVGSSEARDETGEFEGHQPQERLGHREARRGQASAGISGTQEASPKGSRGSATAKAVSDGSEAARRRTTEGTWDHPTTNWEGRRSRSRHQDVP